MEKTHTRKSFSLNYHNQHFFRTCGSDGHWTDEQPTCVEVFCSLPDEVAHGTRNIISLRVMPRMLGMQLSLTSRIF